MGETWQPRLIALDIDGTLIQWVEGQGQDNETIAPAVKAAVHRALAGGAQIVLASGRSIDAMVPVLHLLDLHLGEQVWIVASNGGVVVRYPPVEVVHEERFDAADAVRAILVEHPTAIVAVEEYGVGYRVSHEFPPGELSGRQLITAVDDLVAEPVNRVIIRDPAATPEDFVALGRRLGLHNTEYVIGWSAWMDLSPIGVTKASGLARVAAALGVTAADALAIGDGRNDLEMLRWAHRGVAMGQAIDEVKHEADDVTAPVEEDGVAVELARWFPASRPQP
ncbi:HAD family hydrolase [Nocardioides jejuensis]|uniref:HAD family phosphatase n=1 Tax=Nocardioides jejuensis TaxID=2502782 RepID=A0A4R1CJF3_9ACTN|nr:HAD family hydrolase [Nocardioides jejuensis]TCJ30485.1 HAD family phosphatase [Nocardioides jejuensis]